MKTFDCLGVVELLILLKSISQVTFFSDGARGDPQGVGETIARRLSSFKLKVGSSYMFTKAYIKNP